MCLSVTAQTIEQYYDLNNTIWRFIELTNYGCSASRITEIAGNIPSDIIIPDNVSAGEDNYLVTEIGEHVFSDRVIETISIPSSVCVIGYNAFYGCSTMWAVMTPSMEDWCKLWFNGYYSNPIRYATYLYVNGKAVRDVVIPESVTSLHSYAFAGYSELRTVKFHEQLTSIGQFAFENCKNMTFEKLPDNLSSIGSSAFHGCKALTSLIIPEGVVSIGDNCFTGCTALTSVVIPSSVTSIGNYAFAGINAETLCFHNKNCDNVGYWLDAPYMEPRTSIQKIVFGKEVTNISFNFFGIFSEYMEVEEGNSIYDSRDGCNAVIETATNTLVAASANTVIPNTVVSIGRASFYGSSIESITIPRSVKNIGMNAFYDCNSLTKVVVESEEPIAIEEYVFSNQANATLYVPAGCKAAYEAAANWKDFKDIVEMYAPSPAIEFADANVKALCVTNWDTDGDGELSEAEAAAVTNLNRVFAETTITSFNELQYFTGLSKLGEEAFWCCGDLQEVTLPASLKVIDERAFSCCSSLRAIMIPDGVTTINAQAFESCSKLAAVKLSDNITLIGGGAFGGCNSLVSVQLPESLERMPDAFTQCASLKTIYIPKAVRYASAFSGCSSLESIVVDAANPYLDSRNNCNAIIEKSTNKLIAGCTNTVIPEDVVAIGGMAFAGMQNLKEINIPDGVYDIGFDAFQGTAWYDNQPDGLVYAGHVAYRAKGQTINGTDVILREGTKGIAEYAFEDDNCQGPASITIPESMIYIAPNAFWQCWEMQSLYLMHHEPLDVVEWISDTPERTTLYVPYGSKESYMKHPAWSKFKEIIEFAPDADTDISQLNNVIYINKVEGHAGAQLVLPVQMKNSAAIRGFQFDLYLPDGVTAAKNNKGRILASLSNGRREAGDEHTLTVAEQEDGGLRFLCGSQYDETFMGNDGEILTVTLNIAEDMDDGDYPLVLKNIKLTETDISKTYETAMVKSTLTVSSYMLGDINNDGKVDVSDYIGVANRILNIPQEGFNEKAADVNEDGVIDVSDYIGVANIILTGSIYGKQE